MVAELVCPKGHLSTESDYCSECGARMGKPASAAPSSAAVPEHCPLCGAVQTESDATFCEICGYNFKTGSGPADPLPPGQPSPGQLLPAAEALPPAAPPDDGDAATRPPDTIAAAPPRQRVAIVSVDSQPHTEGGSAPPAGLAAATYVLTAGTSVIGRRSAARALFPELDLSYDTAVSHRHAVLVLDAHGGLVLRDVGSSNGTRLNGKPVAPLKDTPLTPGDVLTLGHWSRIEIGEAEDPA